jgi:uncharacterized cupredoxin-like copper-binding protein
MGKNREQRAINDTRKGTLVKMTWNKTYPIVLALLSVLVLAACGGAGTPSPANLSVDMHEFTFTPSSYTVPAGAEVNLTLTNSGTLEHEWVVMNQGVQVSEPFDENDEANIYWEEELDAGQSGTFTYTAPQETGEYQVVCGIAGHLEAGMVGTLTVSP